MQGTLPSVRPTVRPSVGIFGSRWQPARPAVIPSVEHSRSPLLFLSRIRDGRITRARCTLAKCSEMRGIWVDSGLQGDWTGCRTENGGKLSNS